jgi:carbon starvation protein CstA
VNPRRLRIGEWVLGLGGAVLLASMFLGWYGVDGANASNSAWEAFGVFDVVLAVVAVWAVAAALAAAHNTPAVSLAMASMLVVVAAVVLIVLVVRVIDPPTFQGLAVVTEDDGTAEVTRLAGLWVGVAALAALTVGAFAAVRDERFPRAARIDAPVEPIPPPEGGSA